MNATLKELVGLIQDINTDTRRRGTMFEFRLLYPELNKPSPRVKDIGTITHGQKGFDDTKTLSQLGFAIGDFLDIAIIYPTRGPPPRRIRPY